MVGRKQKPTELKLLRMNAKKAEKYAKRITPTPGPIGEPPPEFNAEQRAEWEYAVANAPRDVLKKVDKGILAAFVASFCVHRTAVAAFNASQILVKTPKQELPMQNPYLTVMNQQSKLMRLLASELGFTPCSRARIDAGNVPAQLADGWEDVG